MGKTFLKNLLRDIKKTISGFLSIAIIIAVGVAFYSGVRATSPDMKMSGDYYFNKNNFMDFKIVSTLGLTQNDIAEIKKQKGVTKVQGSYSIDAVTEKDKRQLVLNIDSLPDINGINSIKIVRGRRAENAHEAVVEERFFRENKLKLNDDIVLKSGNDSNLGDNLKNIIFKVVGTAESPLYVSSQRQLSSVGSGSVKGFLYILPQVFKSEVYTEAYVRTESSQSKDSLIYNENYKNYAQGIKNNLKGIGVSRCDVRYAEVFKKGSDKLKEAQAKLDSSKKETAKKFSDVHNELNASKDKIVQGTKEIKKSEALFNQKIKNGEKQIEDGKEQILSGENEINARKAQIDDGRLKLDGSRKQLDESEAELNAGKAQAADKISAAVSSEAEKAQKLMESDPTNKEYAYKYDSISRIYEKDIKDKNFDSMYSSLKKDNMLGNIKAYADMETLKNNFDKSASQINGGRKQLESNGKKIQEAENALGIGISELEANKKKIAYAEDSLSKQKQEGIKKIENSKKELEDGQKKIDANYEKLKSEEKNADIKFKDAEAEINENKEKLNDIKDPDWYVLGRSENVGYESYRQDSDRINNIGKVFPLIFFLVASLVSLTTMTRMVQEERTQIGVFKALGYSRGAIISHYLIYSLLAGILGSVIGVSIGFRLFPPLIMNAYASLYAIPYSVTPFNMNLALQASVIAVLFTSLAAVSAALDELKEVPASLMRPKSPKAGKVILLEKIDFIWKKLSFTKKVAARNIFRYKQRFFMTVMGIAACTGLLITGFGLREGITGAAQSQFNNIYRYDMQGTLSKNINEADKNNIKEKAIKDTNIKSILFAYSKNSSVKVDSENQDAYLVVPEDKALFNNYINLTFGGKKLKLDDNGVILTEKLSKLVNKKAGDSIQMSIDDKVVTAQVSAVTEHYIQHYIYMSPAYYKKITGNNITFNSFYGLIRDKSEAAEIDTSNALKSIGGINSTGFKNNVHVDYNKSIKSVDSAVLVLIISAGVLAFVVIYNLTNINIDERERELATIKLLGFYDHELALYIYRENMMLTFIGSLLGIAVGMLLDNFVITTAETNIMMFFRKINPVYFLYSVLLTILFSVIVNLAMYKRFDKIDMIESLKSPE